MSRVPAAAAARWRSDVHVWLDHCEIVDSDVGWLAAAKRLTLWAVKHPPGLFARLPALEFLDVRGGTGASADFVIGCAGLRGVVLSQVRGMVDLSAISDLDGLEFLSLHGLPKVTALPSAERLAALRRVELGSMKGLTEVTPILDAPNLAELQFERQVNLPESDVTAIRDHPTLRKFGWFAEDVPDRQWVPVVTRVDKPATTPVAPEDWLDHAQPGTP